MLNALSRLGWSERRLDVRLLLRVAVVVLALALVVQAVRLALTFVEPSGAPVSGLVVSAPRAPVVAADFDPFFRNGVGDSAAAAGQGGEHALTLFGVRAGGGQGGAILAGPDGVQRSYRVGDEVAPGVVLRSVGFDHVILARGGVSSRLDFPPSAATYVPPPAPPPAQAARPAPAQTAPAPAPAAPAEPSS